MQHQKNKDSDFLCQLCFWSLQWNLLTADILYSELLSTMDFFLKNGWNDAKTLKTKPLCSRHFIANTSLQWTSFLAPKPHYPLELTPNSRDVQYKAFLARNVHSFYFWQCFTVLFKFSWVFVVLWKCSDFWSTFILMVDMFSSCKDIQSSMGQG